MLHIFSAILASVCGIISVDSVFVVVVVFVVAKLMFSIVQTSKNFQKV